MIETLTNYIIHMRLYTRGEYRTSSIAATVQYSTRMIEKITTVAKTKLKSKLKQLRIYCRLI